MTKEVQVVSLADLREPGKTHAAITEAFGAGGLGIILVKLPADHPYHLQRKALLSMAPQVASLSASELQHLEVPKALYNLGWSHGREIMNGVPDVRKGSFYAMVRNRAADEATEEMRAKFPFYFHCNNVWPEADCSSLQEKFLRLSQTICDVAFLLSLCIDLLLREVMPGEQFSSLSAAISSKSNCHKGRLLYYYPSESDQENSDDWCGLHLDHSLLTGLTRAITNKVDPESGLFIGRPDGSFQKVDIPEDCLAFQVGEAAEVLSKRVLRATPHLVKGSAKKGVERSTLAVFLQPEIEFDLSGGLTFGKFTDQILATHYGNEPVM